MTVACPACVELPAAQPRDAQEGGIQISLPQIHCAACIAGVEKALMATPGVLGARVNLSLRRVRVMAAPGVAPETFVAAIERAGFTAQLLDTATLGEDRDAAGNALLMRLAVAGFAMMNVMLLSVAVWSGAADATRDFFHAVASLIALPTVAYAGQPFYISAWRALRVRRLNMDVPISLAIILAAAMSLYETFEGGQHAYFDAALSLTFFLLIGRYLDHRARRAARSAAQALSALEVHSVPRLRGDRVDITPTNQIVLGDTVRITAGARLPVDGIIRTGTSQIDRGFVTGESRPLAVGPGDAVLAGDVNLSGLLDVEVTAAGADSTLRRMAQLVDVAETARNRYTSIADRAAAIYAPVVHILALAAFIVWWMISGDIRLSLNIAIAVLIITCPCALGLAVPAVTTVATGKLFRRGLLLKNATVLERLAEVDVVVFDKTGTLTTGRIGDFFAGLSGAERSVLLALAQASAHPVSRAIVAGCPADVIPATLTNVAEVAGQGVSAKWGQDTVFLGRDPAGDGTVLQIGAGVAIAIGLQETLRKGVSEVVAALNALNIEAMILTGDTDEAAKPVALAAGIAQVRAGLLPEEKYSLLRELQADGRRVLMVGDGLNDTPALALAHASLAPASAIEAARIVSDMVLLSEDFTALPGAISVARQARRRVVENFGMAIAYNLVAVPIALAGFATPLIAAIAMSVSSLSVLINALRISE